MSIVGKLKQFQDSENKLTNLQNTIEQMATPLLLKGFQNIDKNIKQYVDIFIQINREDKLKEFYFDYHIQQIKQIVDDFSVGNFDFLYL